MNRHKLCYVFDNGVQRFDIDVECLFILRMIRNIYPLFAIIVIILRISFATLRKII